MSAGYSGTPLAKKLGVKDGQRTWRFKMPASVAEEIAHGSFNPVLLKAPERGLDMAHLFVTRRSDLTEKMTMLRPLLNPAGIVWVSWPKKTAGVLTEITEHVVRDEAFALGMVDIKVCAVDETWTGLKLVIRKSERLPPTP